MMNKVSLYFLVNLLFSASVFAQTMEPYFALSGERLPPQERLRISQALSQKTFDPEIWPEVTFVEKKQTLIPFTRKQAYWEVALPVFNHTSISMETFSGFKFFPATNFTPEKSRLVVIYPTIEGESIIERNLVRMALAEGHHALIAPVFDFPYKTGEFALDDLRERTLFGVKAVKTFFDLIQHCYQNESSPLKKAVSILKTVRPDQIAQIGASNGTVATMMVSQTDPRVSRQALIVPIGNVPAVFAKTTNEKLAAFRSEQMAYHKISDLQEFANLVRKRLQVDPLDVFGLFADDPVPKTLAFTQSEDSTVPPEFQKEVVDRVRAMSVTTAMDRIDLDILFSRNLHEQAIKLRSERGVTQPELAPFDQNVADETKRKRIMEAIHDQQHYDSLFHEIGFGHVKKILAVTFIFNHELRTFMSADFNPRRAMTLGFYAARGIKLNSTAKVKPGDCKDLF